MESTDGYYQWRTIGILINIIEADCQILADSIDYNLFKDEGANA
jgi:hypothetical protein